MTRWVRAPIASGAGLTVFGSVPAHAGVDRDGVDAGAVAAMAGWPKGVGIEAKSDILAAPLQGDRLQQAALAAGTLAAERIRARKTGSAALACGLACARPRSRREALA